MTRMQDHVANRLPRQLRKLVQEGMDAGIISPADASAIAFAYTADESVRAKCLAALVRKFMTNPKGN